MSISSMNTDRMSSVNYQSQAEPNIYFQPPFASGAASHDTRRPAPLQNSRDESSEVQRDTLKVIDEHLKKQMKKIKVLLTVAVSVIGVFLALAIGLSFLATIRSQKQLPLPDIDEEVTKHVAPFQGNLTTLNNQLIDIYGKQLNQYAQLTQQMNEHGQQIETLNDITEKISSDFAGYIQQTESVEDSVNENRATIEQMRNNYSSTSIPTIKTKYIWVGGHPLRAVLREMDPSTFATHGFISQLSVPNTTNEYTSADNTIAYRPHYNDTHNSNLAVLFFNLEATFPCLMGNNRMPVCSLFTLEEDGFLGGRPLIQAGDGGNSFHIFNSYSNVKTFGFGFAGCDTFDYRCVPNNFELSLVCLLPRSVCT